jgi:hypothetical protein
MTGGIQAIAHSKVVRQRHQLQGVLNSSTAIESEAIGIQTEHIQGLKIPGRRCRPDRISINVDGWHCGVAISIPHAGKESENSLTRGFRIGQARSLLSGSFDRKNQ